MRLIDIKRYIKIGEEKYNPTFSNSNGNYYIDNILSTKEAIEALKEANILPLKNINESGFIAVLDSAFTNRIVVSNAQYNSFLSISDKIKFMIDVLNDWIDDYVVSSETENTINIKLPTINKLKELSTVIDLLESSLNEISKINDKDEIVVEQVDHGSLWVIVFVGTALKVITKAINAALDIAKKKVELDQAKELLKRSKLENSAIQRFVTLQEKVIDQLLIEHSSDLEKSDKAVKGLANGEREMRYKKALKELTQLICAGTEFHPALLASQDIIESFPKFDNQITFRAPIAELPRNNDVGTNDSPKDKEPNQK